MTYILYNTLYISIYFGIRILFIGVINNSVITACPFMKLAKTNTKIITNLNFNILLILFIISNISLLNII